ncbi:ATP-binding cassette domain-containing protein [Mycoplasmopsis synoviae]|uniref:ATP-binding cassette domain-containing protein n=1 Tax=Mycoplasmopsis synoviae TaxID=2109 RepID=UPI00036673EC|nr:ATP-binding cassette domain-containing protein [Mycoplasmopsis synoviae]AKB11384.1 hypothetical protein VY93_03640 [Mycoplasmopsis synoviae ATCC 25204]
MFFENKIAFLIHKSIFKAILNRKITFKSEEDPDNSLYLLSQSYRDFSTEYIGSVFGFVLNLAVILSTIALSLNNVVPLSIVILALIHSYLFNNHIVYLFNIVSDLGQFKVFKNNVYSFLKEIPYESLLPNEEFKSLSVKNLTLGFDHMQVFKDFNLEVLPKQKVLIQGESDCGKSTLAKIIVNLNNDDYLGEIFYNKINITPILLHHF